MLMAVDAKVTVCSGVPHSAMQTEIETIPLLINISVGFRLIRFIFVKEFTHNFLHLIIWCRSQWPRGLRRGSAVARLLGLRVRICQGTWMSVCCDCCVLSGRGLCVGPITRPEESYREWCVLSVIVKSRI
jgi:hypothetical protein